MSHPLLYEINTRCWLRGLAEQLRRQVTLADVPDAEFDQWTRRGFTHIWLMGVWTGGPRARAEALRARGLREAFAEALPDWQEADVAASPYAIADYHVPAALGGDEGLGAFRARLHRLGLKLVLDFVPNHLGVDHAWVHDRPELFVGQAAATIPGAGQSTRSDAFLEPTPAGARWLAYGKDPYFPPWTDTVQLDYRRIETRAAMTEQLQRVAQQCDGVRCDMAMLLLNDVFAKTWAHIPAQEPSPCTEFWSDAITAVKREQPDFIFLAEAYWGTETRLQALGFDYTYDKALYDKLLARDAAGVQAHLFGLSPRQLAAGAHFLENHDEPRVAALLSLEEHRAAALLILGLPGLRFLHEGQLTGARRRLPVQLGRRADEPVQPQISDLYEQLLAALQESAASPAAKNSGAELLRPSSAWADNPTAQNLILLRWTGAGPDFDLAVVNLATHRSQCYAPVAPAAGPAQWLVRDRLSAEQYVRNGEDLRHHGLYLDLPPHGAQLLHFQPQQ